MNQSRIELMEKAPVKKAIFKLAIPTMLAMTVQLVYNLTDTFFIGQLGNPDLVAAISLVGPIIISIQAVGNIFANGSSSYISRKLGEKDNSEAKQTNSVGFYTAIGCGIAMTLLLLLFRNEILSIIGTSHNTIFHAYGYYSIIAWFSGFLLLQVSLSGLIRSEGATDKAMIGMFIGIGINIILDPVFIFGLNMGVVGAAWATVIGNSIGSLYYIRHFFSENTLLSIKFKDFRPSKKIYAETLKIGIPSAISMLVVSFTMVLVNVLSSKYGDHVVAGVGIEMRVASICMMLLMGLGQGYQPFAGYNYGARNFDRLLKGFKTNMLYGTILCIVFTGAFTFHGRNLIGLFIDDAATVEAGTRMLHAFTCCLPFFGIQMTMMVTFSATGKARQAMVISLGRQCILYIPLLFILDSLFGFRGLIFAHPVADNITTAIAVFICRNFLNEIRTLDMQAHKQHM